MKIHTCTVCAATSDASKFYAGVNHICAECHKSKVRANRAAKLEYYRAFDAARFQENPARREAIAAYHKTDRGKEVMLASRRKWLESNADKRAAHVILGNAVRNGRVYKPLSCEACGAYGVRIHGHHHDYTKPLDVKWLCPACHRKEHA